MSVNFLRKDFMKKLILSVFVFTSALIQSALDEKLSVNQDKIQTIKAYAKAGKLMKIDSKCSGHFGGCSAK